MPRALNAPPKRDDRGRSRAYLGARDQQPVAAGPQPMSAAPDPQERGLGPGEWAIVALLAEQPVHGWGLIQKLRPDGEIGAVWSLPRPSVYRALEALQQRGLIEESRLERGERGPYRMVFQTTRQ